MEQEKIENYLREMRNEIEVDEQLKRKLRSSFMKKEGMKKNSWLPFIAAAILFLAVFLPNLSTKEVRASLLIVGNGISFFDIGSGEVLAYTHVDGRLYLSLRDRGIYLHENDGLKRITEQTAGRFSRNAEGGHVLFTQNGDVFLLQLETNEIVQVMEGNYGDPEWKDEDHFYVVSDQTILEINLQTKEEKAIVKGEQPSFIAKDQKLVFHRDGKILLYDLKNDKEDIVDHGKDPSTSPNGHYISYVKSSSGVEDVWIADSDLDTKKKLTANPPPRYESTEKAIYRYQSPIWAGEERQLYVMKTRIDGESQPVQIMKIELSVEAMTAKETVKGFLQALVVRDDDYAMSLMKHPPSFLTYSNPHQIGFQIVEMEEQPQSATVQAEVYWTDTALPYYQITTYEFTLAKEKGRFVIEQVKELPQIKLSANDQNQVQLVNGDDKEILFSLQDVPQAFIADENVRFSSLVITPDENTVLFSLQGEEQVAVLAFDRETKSFTLLTAMADATVTQLSLDSSGRYVAADTYTSSSESNVALFDVIKGKQIAQFTNANSVLWRGNQLILQEVAESHTLLYEYDPQNKRKKTY
ncbi:hypothetical protein AB1K83_08735 [Sporosarcina sp. 179-K 3D1 HS]|uniref:hypothetical protein n=1 Tax=Sporosarcina sp. 179-K 3D1 HS TaxID=3232169 RepID=UPI0039A0F3E5